MNKWTPQDEMKLQEMMTRKQESLRTARKPLVDLFERLDLIMGCSANDVADALIEHADIVRDALAPFDSGVRAAPERN